MFTWASCEKKNAHWESPRIPTISATTTTADREVENRSVHENYETKTTSATSIPPEILVQYQQQRAHYVIVNITKDGPSCTKLTWLKIPLKQHNSNSITYINKNNRKNKVTWTPLKFYYDYINYKQPIPIKPKTLTVGMLLLVVVVVVVSLPPWIQTADHNEN